MSFLLSSHGKDLNRRSFVARSPKSFFAIFITDVWLISTLLTISLVFLLVPGLSSCEQISCDTASIFSSQRADCGRPLPTFLVAAEPVLLNRLQIDLTE